MTRASPQQTGVDLEQLYQFADGNNVTAIGGYHRTIGTGYFLVRVADIVVYTNSCLYWYLYRAADIASCHLYTGWR